MDVIYVETREKCCLVDITGQVINIVEKSGVKNGTITVFSPHTTAGITINENADPDVKTDIIMKLDKIVTEDRDYLHFEGNSAAHIKTLITGSSAAIIISGGKLALGTWQGVFFCEYDGPRNRKVYMEITEKR